MCSSHIVFMRVEFGATETYPLPVGAPLPPSELSPHAEMVPVGDSAAKAEPVEAMETYPLPVGAPLPPLELMPHAEMVPVSDNAAKAL